MPGVDLGNKDVTTNSPSAATAPRRRQIACGHRRASIRPIGMMVLPSFTRVGYKMAKPDAVGRTMP